MWYFHNIVTSTNNLSTLKVFVRGLGCAPRLTYLVQPFLSLLKLIRHLHVDYIMVTNTRSLSKIIPHTLEHLRARKPANIKRHLTRIIFREPTYVWYFHNKLISTNNSSFLMSVRGLSCVPRLTYLVQLFLSLLELIRHLHVDSIMVTDKQEAFLKTFHTTFNT